MLKVTVPYIGQALSVNSYKLTIGRRKTNRTRPEVELWMAQLAEKVKDYRVEELPLIVSVFGKFRDGRVPDLDNLAKVILDALSKGLSTNDRNFRFRAEGYSTGWSYPELEITIGGIATQEVELSE